MGIKGLSDFIKKKSKLEKISVEEFKGEKIAIDASIIMYIQMANARKYICRNTDFLIEDLNYQEMINIWKSKITDFLINITNNNIEPIMVFDGDSCKEKMETHNQREKQRQKKINDMEILNKELEERKKNPFKDHSSFMEIYVKKISSCVTVPKKIQEELMEHIKMFGFNFLISNTEAEKLCTSLCIENKVKAVFSSDTDNLPLGCPIMLNAMKIEPNGNIYFNGYILKNVLKDLNFDFETFQNFCIICGCDFNKNIRGYGPVKCYKQICNLEKIKDEKCLNFEFCKNFFKYEPSQNLLKNI